MRWPIAGLWCSPMFRISPFPLRLQTVRVSEGWAFNGWAGCSRPRRSVQIGRKALFHRDDTGGGRILLRCFRLRGARDCKQRRPDYSGQSRPASQSFVAFRHQASGARAGRLGSGIVHFSRVVGVGSGDGGTWLRWRLDLGRAGRAGRPIGRRRLGRTGARQREPQLCIRLCD